MMNCKRAKLAIALAVGDDLDDAAEGELQRHLAECATCRMHRRELENSLGALHTGPDEERVSLQDSVWPALLVRLPSTRGQRFNGWIPAAALAAACLMMISIINEPPQYGPTDGEPYAVPALPARDRSQLLPLSGRNLRLHRDSSARALGNWGGLNTGGLQGEWVFDPESGELFDPSVPAYNP